MSATGLRLSAANFSKILSPITMRCYFLLQLFGDDPQKFMDVGLKIRSEGEFDIQPENMKLES
jgi:hypothetical protein